MKVGGSHFEIGYAIPDQAYDYGEADEWADRVSASVLPNITSWEHTRLGRTMSP